MTYADVLAFWQHNKISSVSDMDMKLDSFRILFAYNSNRIENDNITYHDTREIFENGKVINYTGDTRTLFEIENQKKCYDFLAEKIVKKKPISISLIKQIHYTLTYGTFDERRFGVNQERPGEFKKHDYVTGINEVGSPPEYVEEDLEALIKEVNGVANEANFNAITVSAYLHAGFEYIHPFADGNGRVGRTLMNYYLMINDHPPLIIYDEDKKDYYNALEIYDTDENLKPLLSFIEKETIKTWEKSVDRFYSKSQNKPLNRGR